MNSIKKQKNLLIAIAISVLVASVLCAIFGVLLLVHGIGLLPSGKAIVKIVFGVILSVLFFVLVGLGVKWLWVALALTATEGSIKQGNIAKEGGTVNMRKCDKCGTELKDGERVCSNCGKSFE